LSRPVLTLVAGSNGCGKSTLTASARTNLQEFPVLDPDAIARSLQSTVDSQNSDIGAGKRVLRLAEEHIAAHESFTVETTLSGNTYLRMATRAKDAGFNLVVFFVGTSSVEINIARVQARVRKGGHDVPEEDQRSCFRWPTSRSSSITPPMRVIRWWA
jgi:predicted ABC-type ATPase